MAALVPKPCICRCFQFSPGQKMTSRCVVSPSSGSRAVNFRPVFTKQTLFQNCLQVHGDVYRNRTLLCPSVHVYNFWLPFLFSPRTLRGLQEHRHPACSGKRLSGWRYALIPLVGTAWWSFFPGLLQRSYWSLFPRFLSPCLLGGRLGLWQMSVLSVLLKFYFQCLSLKDKSSLFCFFFFLR